MILTEKVAAKLRELPDAPGVYQMKDRRGRILYIGKALNLKNRVSTYFQTGAESDPRIAQLVTKIEDLDWIVVPAEIDALILESSLIRQFKPYYNTSLKDDKSYPYIKITTNEAYPRVMITRRYLNDKAKYWGPLTNVMQVRSAVKFIAGLFQLRTCKLELDGQKFVQKPCLDYHLKLCSAPCVDFIKREEYRKLTRYAIEFFNGHYARVLGELKRRMEERAEKRDYESAARYRDLIGAVESSFNRTRMTGMPGENLDIIGVARSKDRACVLLMPVRDGRLVGDHKYIVNHRLGTDGAGDNDEVLSGFIKLHYANPLNVPPRIVLPADLPETALLQEWLTRIKSQSDDELEELDRRRVATAPAESEQDKQKPQDILDQQALPTDTTPVANAPTKKRKRGPTETVVLEVPKPGPHRELLEIAMKNAAERLHTELLGQSGDFVVTPGQQALAEYLGLADAPRRIEGYDIANLQGQQATGAMVVNIGGRKAAREYRLFNIRLKSTPDDFAMLRETLSRRLTRLLSDPNWDAEVDLIMLDGGKGQLSSGMEVLRVMLADPRWNAEQRDSLARIKLCSLAKQEELVYHYPGQFADNPDWGPVQELRLAHTDPGLRLLVGLRDEAHRYGNAQHALLREKAMKLSVLDTIPGIGEAKRRALIKHFGSVKKLREATPEELASAPGVGPKLAAELRKYLDRDEQLEEIKAETRREMKIRRIRRHGEAFNE